MNTNDDHKDNIDQSEDHDDEEDCEGDSETGSDDENDDDDTPRSKRSQEIWPLMFFWSIESINRFIDKVNAYLDVHGLVNAPFPLPNQPITIEGFQKALMDYARDADNTAPPPSIPASCQFKLFAFNLNFAEYSKMIARLSYLNGLGWWTAVDRWSENESSSSSCFPIIKLHTVPINGHLLDVNINQTGRPAPIA